MGFGISPCQKVPPATGFGIYLVEQSKLLNKGSILQVRGLRVSAWLQINLGCFSESILDQTTASSSTRVHTAWARSLTQPEAQTELLPSPANCTYAYVGQTTVCLNLHERMFKLTGFYLVFVIGREYPRGRLMRSS